MARQRRGRGDGTVYQRADGYWVGQIDLGWIFDPVAGKKKRKRKTVTAKTRKDALDKLRRAQRSADAGMIGDDPTVAAWMQHWLDDIAPARVRPRTLQGYRSYVTNWITPTLGSHRLSKLRPEHVRAMHKAMVSKEDSTRRQAHMILRRALVIAEREGHVLRNPAALVDPPPVGTNHHASLTPEQAKRVLDLNPDPAVRARLCVALLMGLRQGEALALDWDDVDLEVGVAHVHRSLSRVTGTGLVIGKVKSAASDRYVAIVGPVVDILKAYRLTAPDGLVFGGAEPIDPSRDYKAWTAALERAGVPAVPLHGARATCASLLLELGIPERVIADILGHAQITITRTAYERSHDEQRRRALEAAGLALLPES